MIDTATSAVSALGELPISPLIAGLGKGIAEAQLALDEVSIRVAQMMAGGDDEDRVTIGKRSYSLLELGLTPTFYQFTETVLEVKVSISMTIHGERGDKFAGKLSSRRRVGHRAQSVDASYSCKYQYNVEGSSRVRTKLMPVPPPAVFEERVRRLMVVEDEFRQLMGRS